MKQSIKLLTVFCLFLFVTNLKAQDLIYLKTSEIIQAKIVEVGDSTVTFFRLDDKKGQSFWLSKKLIRKIEYADGNILFFDKSINPEAEGSNKQSSTYTLSESQNKEIDYYSLGVETAKQHYDADWAMWMGGLSAMYILFFPLALALVLIASRDAKSMNKPYLRRKPTDNAEFREGYRKEVWRKILKRAADGALRVFIAFLVAALVIIAIFLLTI